MNELTEQEKSEAASSLTGVKIWFIIEIIFFSIGVLSILVTSIVVPIIVARSGSDTAGIFWSAAGLVTGVVILVVFLVLYIVALVSIKNRKRFSYPLMKAVLIISMFSVPVGTIVGAILLSKISNDAAKRYLNYGLTVQS